MTAEEREKNDLFEEDVSGIELESRDLDHGAGVRVAVGLCVGIGLLEGGPGVSVDMPVPGGEGTHSLVLPCAQFAAREHSVLVVVVRRDDNSRVGGGKGADGELVLLEVESSVVVGVNDVPVLRREVVDEALVLGRQLDVLSDLGGADGEFRGRDDAVGAAAVNKRWLVRSIAGGVDGFLERSGVVRGEVVDVQGLGPP